MKYLEYKGYTGSIEYSSEDKVLFGKVLGIRSLLSYEGNSGVELETDFRLVIDEYLEDCNQSGVQPETPYKGSFNVRVSSDLHRALAIRSIELNTSQNQLVGEALRRFLMQKTSS